VDHVALAALGRQVDRDREAGLAGGPAGESELADDRRAIIREQDLDGDPGAGAGAPVEQRPSRHPEVVGRHDRRGDEPDEQRRPEGGDREGATGAER
jgi:hypothetical protein